MELARQRPDWREKLSRARRAPTVVSMGDTAILQA
jgi:hypothetical protein